MSTFDYPRAPRLDLTESLHGQLVADPYRWLEDARAADTVEWAQHQDALYEAVRDTWPLTGHFAKRLTELLSPGSETAPIWRGHRRFLTRRRGTQEHGVLLTVVGTDESVLLDPLALDPEGTTTLDSWQPSKEGDRLAYQLSAGGTEDSLLWVIDVESGAALDGPVDRVRYSPIAWVPGGKEFYYVRRLDPSLVPADEAAFHRRVYLHRVGTSATDDVEVFGAGLAATSYFGVTVSRDGRWLIITNTDGTEPRNDVWIADLVSDGLETPQLREVVTGADARTSAVVGRDGLLYIFTNLDATHGRLAVTSPTRPTPDQWRTLIADSGEAVLDDVAFLDDLGCESDHSSLRPLLIASWTRHAVAELTVHDLATGDLVRSIDLPGLGTLGPLVERPEGGHEVWFNYTDYVTPPTVYRYDATTEAASVWSAPPDGTDTPPVSAQQIEVVSTDGTIVRAFVLTSEASMDEPRPTILYGYGGFRISMTPAYSASALAWVEAGGTYVVAALRGGSEEGEEWHRAGMLGNKQNVFDDFYAVAEHLIATEYTTPDLLVAQGGSNGGLLVGVALTQRPELFAGIVCSAPLLDMVRYEQFGLGRTWAPEYGTADAPEEFAWLYAYSPYHHVAAGTAYPSVLFTVFDSDTRVDPLHARKLAAALQWATSSDRRILLRNEKDVGHSARSLSRSVGLSSEVLGFTAAATGLAAEVPRAVAEGVS